MESTSAEGPPVWQRTAGAPSCPACGKTCPADGETCEHCGALLHPERPDRRANGAGTDPYYPWSAVQQLNTLMPVPAAPAPSAAPTATSAVASAQDGPEPAAPEPVVDVPTPVTAAPAPPAPAAPQAPVVPQLPSVPQLPNAPQPPAVPQLPDVPRPPSPVPHLPAGLLPRTAILAAYEAACAVAEPEAPLDGLIPAPVVRPVVNPVTKPVLPQLPARLWAPSLPNPTGGPQI